MAAEAEAGVRPSVDHLPQAPGGERELVEKVAACVDSFEKGIGVDFKERSENFYRLYRGFKKFRNAWEAAGPNDRDGVLYDAKKTWGANLHIPLSFRTIETMVPRAIAHRPRMLYLPREQRWEQNVHNVRLLHDAQQEQIDIDLAFQDVMRAGMIYGLGVGKAFWRTEWAPRRRVKRRMFRPGYQVGKLAMEKVFDDPDFEAVDVLDFGWDPYSSDINRGSSRARWVYHRVWLNTEECLHRVKTGAWNTVSAKALTAQHLESTGSGQRYDEVWQARMTASGMDMHIAVPRSGQIHEVWEWHDGHRILTVLDRQTLVQDAESPCAGHIPFQIYRPTRLPHQMVGIGEIEPVQHLQRELDTLRSQRRDAATLALCAGYAFDSSMVERDDLVFGPFAAIEVINGSPREALLPLQRQEVPGSGYQEEQVIRGDFDAVTGISDALDPNNGAAGTATEAQLVQAALSQRIQVKSRRFEIEVVKNVARVWLYLNQRMIVKERQAIRQPGEGLSPEEAARTSRWRWFPIGPGELQGEFEIVPEGGSMAAENIPQMRQDAVQKMQLFGDSPHVDQRRVILSSLKDFGIDDPESWLKKADEPVPPLALKILVEQLGVDPRVVEAAVQVAQQQDPQLAPEQQGPNAQQVEAMMQPQAAAA